MRHSCDVTDRHGNIWHCELLRLRLTAGAHPDVRARARVLCRGDNDSFELELLATDWVELSEDALADQIAQEASCRRASERHAAQGRQRDDAVSGAA